MNEKRLNVLSDVLNRPDWTVATATSGLNNKQQQQQHQRRAVITASGFRGAAKQHIQTLAAQSGATYSGELVQGCTTHLVCKRLIDCFATPKYQRALEWGIPIVSYNWLLASAAAGHLVPEQDYTDDGPDAWNPSPAPARQQSRKQQQQSDAATPAQTSAWLSPIQTQQREQERQGSSDHGAGAKAKPVAAQEQQCTGEPATSSSSATSERGISPLQHRQQQVVQSASTPAGSSNSRPMQLQSTRPEQAQHGIQQQQQDPPAANINSSSSQAGTKLFTFASELPPNFLLLGSDSPRSEEGDGARFSPLVHFSLSQVRPDQQQQQQKAPAASGLWTQQQAHQQQQELEQVHTDVNGTPSHLGGHQAPAAAAVASGGGGGDGSVQEFHFHMHSHDTPQQQVSPCMQSFLPMLQQQGQEVVHGLSPAGSYSTQDRLQLADRLAGSELQPDGVLDLPVLLPPEPGATAQSAAAAAGAAVLPAASMMRANAVPAGCTAGAACSRPAATAGPAAAAAAGGGMLIPETQFEEELGLGISAAAGRGCGLQLPCKTPDSLAHYVNKQRRRQKALAPAWDDSRTTSQHSHHYEQQQEQQEPGTLPGSRELAAAAPEVAVAPVAVQAVQQAPAADHCPPGGDAGAASGAAWPPSWLQRAAAAKELTQQQQLHQDTEQTGCDSTAAPAAARDDDGWPCADSTSGEEQEEPDQDQLNQQGHSSSSTKQQHQQEEELRQPKQQVDHSSDRTLANVACTGDAAVKDASSRGRPWSSGSSSSSTSMGLVRLKRRDGYRRQAGRVLVSSPPPLNPADLAELEDSDCDIADVDADVSDDSYDCRDGSAADAASSDDLTDEHGIDCADAAGARRRLQHGNQEQQQQRCEDISCKLTAKASAAAAALAAAFTQADGRQQHRTTVPLAAAEGGHLAPAAAVDGMQQQEQLRHKRPHLRRHAYSPVQLHSCSGSSLPTGSRRAPSAAAAAASFADSEDDDEGAFHSAASASSQPSGSLLTECSSQGALPVMRLNFSLGGCNGSSSPLQQQQTPAGSTAQQQQQVQQHEEEAGEEAGCGGCSETDTECSGSQEQMGDAAWSPDSGSLGNNTSATTSSSSRQSTSSSSPHSNASSRFRLKQRSAAAGGTAATAAVLMQKRQALKQQEQQQQQASPHRPAFVTPPSEGSQFVTRRKCPRPTTDHAAASSSAAAAAAESTAQQPFYPGTGAGTGAAAADAGYSSADAIGGGALQQGGPWDDGDPAAAALSGLSDADDTEASDAELQRGVHSGSAGVPAAEQLLRDLKQRQQDQQQQQGVAPGAGRKKGRQHPKQQQPAAADAFLRDLRLQQQQQGLGQRDGSMALSSRAGHSEAIDPATQATAANSAATAGAAPCWRSRSSAKPRLSVTSSSCVDTQLSTASHKVPLALQGGGIILHSCSASSSSSICTTGGDDGLAKALHKALADTAAVGPAGTLQGPVVQQQELDKQRQGVGGVTGASADAGHQQEALTRFSSSEVGALQYQQQQPCDAILQQGQQQAEQQDVSWLHTPEDPQQQQKQQQGSQVDLVGMSTVGVAARGAAMSQHLGARLAQLSQAQEEVVALKLLQKAPRGSTAKAHHGLKSSSKLTYADQVQVPWAHATISTKERSRGVIIAGGSSGSSGSGAGGSSGSSSSATAVFVGEPVAFYKLPSGEWWVELLRFYSAKDLRELAKTCGQPVHLPPDFQLSYELLRGIQHEHWPMRQLQGEFRLSKVRKVPTGNRSRAQSPFFWRYSLDACSCQLLTDRPVTDFLVQ